MGKGRISQKRDESWVRELWTNFRLALSLLFDKRVPLLYKVVIPLLWVVYLLLPLDLLPDVVPILGEMDDLALLVLAAQLLVLLSPKDVVEEHLRKIRGERPVSKDKEEDVIDGEWHVVE
jgi:uncharacterized membrane protein YkvA (DUF1232 family)